MDQNIGIEEQREGRFVRGLIRDTLSVAGIKVSAKSLSCLGVRFQPEFRRLSQDRNLLATVNAIPGLLQGFLRDVLDQIPTQLTEPEKLSTIQKIVHLAARKVKITLPIELEKELAGTIRAQVGERAFDLLLIDELTASIRRAFRSCASVLRRYSTEDLQDALRLMTPAERNEVVAHLTGDTCKKCGSQTPEVRS